MNNTEYLSRFNNILAEMSRITEAKHSDYGDDAVFGMGMKMRFADIYRKYQRLKAIMWDMKEAQVKDETLRDTLIDLANYAVIAIIQMDLENDSKPKDI